MNFDDLLSRAERIRNLYSEYELEAYGRNWTGEEVALGFVGDVGDLMKLIIAQKGMRDIQEVQQKMAHELADCLWSVLVLANIYGINLPEAFMDTMARLEEQIEQKHRRLQEK